MARHGRRSLILAAIAAVVIALPIVLWKSFERQTRLSYIPESLGVTRILYAQEESWGFGPGGNETGVIAYELPAGVSERLSREGKTFLESLPVAPDTGDWRGRYERWQQTPIEGDKDWLEGDMVRYGPPGTVIGPRLENYLDKYGFGIEVDPAILKQINDAISHSGSLFAYGRIGVIILVPHEGKVFYVYNG